MERPPLRPLRLPAAARRAAPALLAAGLLAAPPAPAQTGGAPEIRFMPQEQTLFRDLVARDPAEPLALKEPPVIGAMVPLEIELRTFPGFLMAEVPATRGLRYLRTAAGIAVVDPDTRRVVQLLALSP